MIDLLTSPQVLSEQTSEERPTRPEKNQQHRQMRCGVTADICCSWFSVFFFLLQTKQTGQHARPRPERSRSIQRHTKTCSYEYIRDRNGDESQPKRRWWNLFLGFLLHPRGLGRSANTQSPKQKRHHGPSSSPPHLDDC